MISSNPFSTRYVQPGRIPFQLRGGVSIEQLFVRFLLVPQRRAAIVGPHGSGKSSLLETLQRSVPENHQIVAFRLHSDSSKVEQSISGWCRNSSNWNDRTIVTVDGFEQLSWWAQYRIRTIAQNRQVRLLVTSHKSIFRFPVLWTTQRQAEDDAYVLKELLATSELTSEGLSLRDEAFVYWDEIRSRYPTDMREALMGMYDWWEKKTASNF